MMEEMERKLSFRIEEFPFKGARLTVKFLVQIDDYRSVDLYKTTISLITLGPKYIIDEEVPRFTTREKVSRITRINVKVTGTATTFDGSVDDALRYLRHIHAFDSDDMRERIRKLVSHAFTDTKR